jgi:hypothetical protein
VLEETHARRASASTNAESIVTTIEVHLQEDKVFVQLGNKQDSGHMHWILDTGTTNHMTDSRSSFTDLNEAICKMVRFGDGSVVGIEGKGTVVVECKNGEQRKLVGVYHIPKLKANILSLGQLDEDGYHILIERSVLRVWDLRGELLMKVERGAT